MLGLTGFKKVHILSYKRMSNTSLQESVYNIRVFKEVQKFYQFLYRLNRENMTECHTLIVSYLSKLSSNTSELHNLKLFLNNTKEEFISYPSDWCDKLYKCHSKNPFMYQMLKIWNDV